ncbi:hypothetical protein [Natrialba asiatica]|uniref:DUF7974 domain-containing protein n=1 Tax=Natrialba asiatica (strain ATCC 700177 / DSM 12278 / JCM 9576 / FERM P-10747 / NBRC 102637 / 172P1) TaxID=29540 RepID=M0AJH6_NATA1|nr:hypothetical protein [Natrialba asiatica]ELY98032.1 hypothetical protein C481_18890 [Natrialba asiatica DSM 12278]
MAGRQRTDRRPDTARTDAGADRNARYTVASLLAALVPVSLARRAISVTVTADRDVYDRGVPVEFTVTFRNRLPVAVAVPTPHQRRWGWTVAGELEASDERRYMRSQPSVFRFDGGERKRITVTWNGRFERTTDRHEFVVPDPGEYEIRVFVATREGRYQPSDTASIRIR